MATGSGEGSSYEGGVGGKFRKRAAVRRSSTPYDRPPTAIRKTSEAGRASWLLKLVDPASKIITTSAHKLISSVFRNNNNKNLPALHPVPEANHESQDEPPEVVFHNSTGPKEQGSNEGYKLHSGSEPNVINDLEQVLKQKTFTRAEIDRLTELLQSKTVEVSAEGKKKRVEPSTSELAAAHGTIDNVPVPLNQSQSMYKQTSTPAVQSTFLEEDVAAPAELAKAYMGSRTITPSKLGLRSQASREAVATLNNLPFSPKSPDMSLVSKSAVNYNSAPRISGNGYLIPGLRGRSALYSMARTPYSRVHHSSTQKDAGFMTEASPSWENNMLSVGRQVSKRRSSVLDSDIGSIGPIRRIRQKTMMSPSTNMKLRTPGNYLSIPATSSGSKVGQVERKYNNSERSPLENGESIASTSCASVPPQSTETARMILQELDKLVSSPKEKSPELKLAMALETSSTKLTQNMLCGKALKSMETVDSSKLLRGTADGVGNNNHVVGVRDSTSQSQMINENGPNKGSISKDKGAIANGLVKTVPTEDTRPNAMTADKVIPSIDASPSQKKLAFQMSAHEDYLDLDEDIFSTGVGSSTFATDKGKLHTSLVEIRASIAETVTVGKPLVSSSDINSPTSEIMKKSNDIGSSDFPQTAENDSGFNFYDTHASVALHEPASTRQSTFSSPPASSNVSTSASVFSFGPSSTNKTTAFTFSTSVATESPAPKFGASDSSLPKFGLTTETLSSATQAARSQTAPNTVEFDKGSKDGNQKTGDLFTKSENARSTAISSSTTPLISFGASNSNTSSNNGPFASTSLFSAAAAPSASDASKCNDFSSTSNASTTAADVTRNSVSVSGENSTSSVPSLFQFGSGGAAAPAKSVSAPVQSVSTSTPSLFQFGSGIAVAPAKSISAPLQSASSGVQLTDSDLKTKNTSPFGNLNCFLFGTTSASSGSGGGNYVFGSSASSTKPLSSDNNQFQSSSTSAAASGSSFSVLTAQVSTLVPTSQSMATQFASLSPTFGLNGSSSFNSGSSIFGSSSSGKLFGSSSGFTTSTMFSSSAGFTSSLFSSTAQTSAGSASSLFSSIAQTNAGSTSSLYSSTAQISAGSGSFSSGSGSGSGSASILFGSSSQPATSSIFGSGFGSTSSSTGFAFGSSLSVSATVGSAPLTFGSSIGASSSPMFSFSSAAPTSSAPNSSAFPVFAASTAATTFGSASPGNDQMNMEDSMAEDTMQASPHTVSAFGQPANSPQSNFVFGSASGPNIFQMNGQQPPATPQNQSPFQASGSLGISAGGSFSLGTTTGGDKTGRKIIKVRRDRTRKR